MLKIFELGPLIHIPLYYWTRNSPSFSLSDGRASDMQARMKITLPHLAFLEWDDFHTCSRFTRSTIPEGKWEATCSPLNARPYGSYLSQSVTNQSISTLFHPWIVCRLHPGYLKRRCVFLLPSEAKLAFKNTPKWTIIGHAEFVSG